MDYSAMDDKKIKHLELIQAIITRMNSNSFVIKGWVITIVSAVLALLASTHNTSFIVITALPIVVFWIVDSFYLQTERKYVELYKLTIKQDSAIAPFSLNPEEDAIKSAKKTLYFNVFTSRTIISFYLSLLLIAGACTFFIVTKDDSNKSLDVKVSSVDTIRVQNVK
jgi:hypothetical protein